MAQKAELLGRVFGKLTVIENTSPKCLCRCSCGKEKLIDRRKLTAKGQVTCGCGRAVQIRTNKRENALGARAFRLTCIDNRKTGVNRLWRCECGNLIEATPKDVRSGNTKSCGCLKMEHASRMGSGSRVANNKGASQARWRVLHEGHPLQLRSGFELIYFRHLVENGVRFEYEPKTFVLSPQHHYTPDFYLPDTNEWVEVKGYMSERALEKHALFLAAGHKLRVLKEVDIKAMLPAGVSLGAFYLANAKTPITHLG